MTWNPADKGASVALSGGNLVATDTSGGGWNSVRSTTHWPLSSASGKRFAQVTTTAVHTIPGVGDSTESMSSFVGADAHAWGWTSNGSNILHNGTGPAIGSQTGGIVVGLAVDFTASPPTLSFYSGSTPLGGGGANIDISSLSGDAYLMTSVGFNGVATLNESPSFLPAGFSTWAVPPSSVSGNVTLDDIVAAAAMSSFSSQLSGGVTLDDLVAAGSLGAAPGVATVSQLRNWSNQLLTSQLIEKIAVIRVSDIALMAVFTNQTTDGTTADLVLSSPSLVPGTLAMIVGFSADGSASFRRAVTIV